MSKCDSSTLGAQRTEYLPVLGGVSRCSGRVQRRRAHRRDKSGRSASQHLDFNGHCQSELSQRPPGELALAALVVGIQADLSVAPFFTPLSAATVGHEVGDDQRREKRNRLKMKTAASYVPSAAPLGQARMSEAPRPIGRTRFRRKYPSPSPVPMLPASEKLPRMAGPTGHAGHPISLDTPMGFRCARLPIRVKGLLSSDDDGV
jgi:hypothetical protein